MNKQKKELREECIKKRNALLDAGLIENISREICKKITEFPLFKTAENILTFYPKGSEINTLSLIEKFGETKKFYLPVCKNGEITVCPYKSGSNLVLNKYGIYEPKTPPIEDLSILDIVITPCLAADKNFNRLGWGGGYYDKFFKNKNLRAKKVVVLPEALLLSALPGEAHDIKCDILITEKSFLVRSLA